MAERELTGPELDAKAALNSALSHLPTEQREAIELAVGARMTCPQIAERTGVQETTVQRRIDRGLQALLVALRDVPYFSGQAESESERS